MEFARLPAEEVGRLIAQRELRLDGAETICARERRIRTATAARLGSLNCSAQEGETMRCLAGRSQFWISWNGKMMPCGMLDTPAVEPLKVGFVPSWEYLKQETRQIHLCADCVSCSEQDTCLNCAAVMLTETGSFQQRPDYMCRLNRAYREEICALAEKLNMD